MPAASSVASKAEICALLRITMSRVSKAPICVLVIAAICAVDSSPTSAVDQFLICVVVSDEMALGEIELIDMLTPECIRGGHRLSFVLGNE